MALPAEAYREHEFPSPYARRQLDFFAAFNHPHFGLCAQVDVTRLCAFAQASAMGFHLAAVHALSCAANAVPELRRRGRAGHVVEHARVHPSFTDPAALAFADAARAEVARGALPRVNFTGIQHAMQLQSGDWVPRISWGKVVSSARFTRSSLPRSPASRPELSSLRSRTVRLRRSTAVRRVPATGSRGWGWG